MRTFLRPLSIVFAVTVAIQFTLAGSIQVYADDISKICTSEVATINADFPLGGMSKCRAVSNSKFIVDIAPEDKPINPSPWYAFKVSPHKKTIRIVLNYTHSKHRYAPKVSYDARNWAALMPKFIKVIEAEKQIQLTLPASERPLFISAQEFISNAAYDAWSERLVFAPNVEKALLGHSVEGRPIYKIESLQSDVKDQDIPYLFLVGRQHPPEVTGALAMLPFVETIFADTPIAREFRSVFNIIVVPNLNPDGVALGHWRHNTQGKDLNRDWGPFEHVETRLMQKELDAFSDSKADKGRSIWFFLDFHSTARNLLYTQMDEDEKFMKGFTREWLLAARKRIEGYVFTREPRHNSDLPTSKNYVYTRFDIPAITYEVGDETERAAIRNGALAFAEEMMRELLERYKEGIRAPYDQ